MDRLDPASRRALMGRIRSKNTKPELAVRRLVHALGYRFRLHRKDLPGSPDLVFSSKRSVIFVHGCYWHRHDCKRGKFFPAVNTAFWSEKFQRTLTRDRKALRSLSELGWSAMVVWECETRDLEDLSGKVCQFLGPRGTNCGEQL